MRRRCGCTRTRSRPASPRARRRARASRRRRRRPRCAPTALRALPPSRSLTRPSTRSDLPPPAPTSTGPRPCPRRRERPFRVSCLDARCPATPSALGRPLDAMHASRTSPPRMSRHRMCPLLGAAGVRAAARLGQGPLARGCGAARPRQASCLRPLLPLHSMLPSRRSPLRCGPLPLCCPCPLPRLLTHWVGARPFPRPRQARRGVGCVCGGSLARAFQSAGGGGGGAGPPHATRAPPLACPPRRLPSSPPCRAHRTRLGASLPCACPQLKKEQRQRRLEALIERGAFNKKGAPEEGGGGGEGGDGGDGGGGGSAGAAAARPKAEKKPQKTEEQLKYLGLVKEWHGAAKTGQVCTSPAPRSRLDLASIS